MFPGVLFGRFTIALGEKGGRGRGSVIISFSLRLSPYCFAAATVLLSRLRVT
jgi:hypothetical protein